MYSTEGASGIDENMLGELKTIPQELNNPAKSQLPKENNQAKISNQSQNTPRISREKRFQGKKPRAQYSSSKSRSPRGHGKGKQQSDYSFDNQDMKPYVDATMKAFDELPLKALKSQNIQPDISHWENIVRRLEKATEQRDKLKKCELPEVKLHDLKSLGVIDSSVDSKELKTTWEATDAVNDIKNFVKTISYFEPQDPLQYKIKEPSPGELELNKSQMAFSLRSRMLRAISKFSEQHGLALNSTNLGQSQLHGMNKLYPFANPNIPKAGFNKVSDIKSLSKSTGSDFKNIVDTTVRGIRPELKFYKTGQFKTEQSRVNAEVVSHALNSNAQLQVDNMHVSIGRTLVGKGKLADLPQPLPSSE
ncbi:hypothetical protein KL905_001231 [Ogataea polymorpha]|uniref:uncharacterized protein n=1 Tax=Ogataea polymorpha TaxID=460523 RepID=UPI0007F48B1E|nr:uncharacterized protein OGAPODRAFT_15594 [Ogataea polymorpha]KAG7877965.1 hypothetical protein KL937_004478 [Ogataea polymorpha]KAG7896824.1 hypothetical protein KL908_000226 [Ogataea polymorpha]KAG7912022.1 hypothetical protein KL906_000226 [Ogataea polymorpha]KAG7913405.1 hypothetical protein KL907_000350 [Ogataea polymorpha]KAG7922965.1 hypothetical protein KL905_001231 [Ogataea polymorpha]